MRKEDLLKFLEAWPKVEEVEFVLAGHELNPLPAFEWWHDKNSGKLVISLAEGGL